MTTGRSTQRSPINAPIAMPVAVSQTSVGINRRQSVRIDDSVVDGQRHLGERRLGRAVHDLTGVGVERAAMARTRELRIGWDEARRCGV